MHALSGTRSCNPSNQAAAKLRLRPRGHRIPYFAVLIALKQL